MFEPYMPAVALAGLAVLLVLCLPLARVQKLVLELSAWALRLALLALLGAAAYLWFYPADLPAEVADAFNNVVGSFPRLRGVAPEPGTPYFGVCTAALLVGVLLPLLAVLDVTRRLAGWRLRRLRALAAAPQVVETPPAPAPAVHRVNRRAAADALAGVGSRKPSGTT
jgi:hypothetical protein